MKNSILLTMVGLLFISLSSCQKVRTEKDSAFISETYNLSIENGETLRFNLPKNDFNINQDAENALRSEIVNNGLLYEYEAAEDFVGSETVTLSNANSGFCGTSDNNRQQQQTCRNSEKEKQYSYKINITVEPVSK